MNRPLAAALIVIATLAPDRAAAQACVEDPPLARAAAALLASPSRPDARALREAAREAGSDVPELLVHLRSEGAPREPFLASARARLGASLSCGEAHSNGRVLLLVGPAAGRIRVLDDDRVRVEIADGWRAPHLVVRDREGTTRYLEASGGEVIGLPSDLAPPLVVQLVATGADGPRPIAERVLPSDAALEERPVLDSDEPIGARLARLREAARVPPARPNRLLARVARRHAEDRCRTGRASHLGEGGDPVERLARHGVRARHVGETMARAESEGAAYAAMLRSPSHRAALVDRRFTDLGVATVDDGAGHSCVVVLLAAWPRAIPWSP